MEGEALDMEAEEKKTQRKISSIITKKCESLATMHQHTQVPCHASAHLVNRELVKGDPMQNSITRPLHTIIGVPIKKIASQHQLSRELNSCSKDVTHKHNIKDLSRLW